jgi:hypothetical protein
MSAGSWQLYNHVSASLGDGTMNMATDHFRVVLVSSSYTFSAAHSTWADASANELATASGYTQNGIAVTGQAYTQTGGVATFDIADPSWTVSAPGPLASRRAIIVRDADNNGVIASTDKLVASCLLDATPADYSVESGNPYTIVINSGGVFTDTIA